MLALLRAALVALALLTSGVFELAAALEDASCCEEAGEQEAPRPDCTAGVLCACCPAAALPGARPGSSGAASTASGPRALVAEPTLAASVTDIFHPPRP
ncbi:MAG TPA: hypothetical protein VEB43_05245 [Anaeromyxobacter sp.]|nr:hypothetical protein [Anaeromyxobacter sp.]